MFKAKYKCLMCGKEIWGSLPPDVRREDLERKYAFVNAVPPVTTHKCSGDRIGVAILCGYQDGFKEKGDKY